MQTIVLNVHRNASKENGPARRSRATGRAYPRHNPCADDRHTLKERPNPWPSIASPRARWTNAGSLPRILWRYW